MAEKQKSLETIMEELETIVASLEGEQMSLEESYEHFSKGVNLVMEGNKAIDQVEKKIKVLKGDEDHDI